MSNHYRYWVIVIIEHFFRQLVLCSHELLYRIPAIMWIQLHTSNHQISSVVTMVHLFNWWPWCLIHWGSRLHMLLRHHTATLIHSLTAGNHQISTVVTLVNLFNWYHVNIWRLHVTVLLHHTARWVQKNRLRLCWRKTLLSYCNSCWNPSCATCVLHIIPRGGKRALTMISILHLRSAEWLLLYSTSRVRPRPYVHVQSWRRVRRHS